MITIFHNPRCKKSRAGLAYLEEKGVSYEVKNYIKEGISIDDVNDLLMKLNLSPQDMIRTQEAEYKQKYKGKKFTDEEWVKIMVESPKLIKRPIVVKGYKAVWGDPADNIAVLIGD